MPATAFDAMTPQPLKCYQIAYQSDVMRYFERIRHLPDCILLDSGAPHAEGGRFDIMSASPQAILETDRYGIARCTQFPDIPVDPLQAQRALLRRLHIKVRDFPEHLPFKGGLLGFWSYEFSKMIEKLPRRTPTDLAQELNDVPLARLGLYDWAITLDHHRREAWLVASHERRQEVLALINAPDTAEPSPPPFNIQSRFEPVWSYEQYQHAFDRIQHYIREGDCYQVNLTQRFNAPYAGDLWSAYRHLRTQTPAPFSAYLHWHNAGEETAILSVSPERFIQVKQGVVMAQPIKGTQPRGKTPEEDARNAKVLEESSKDRAENVMIVDLLRNDLGHVCAPGTVRVPMLTKRIGYANVHHLVSTITGTLDARHSTFDVFTAAYPGGSITGAPKIRAMEIIEELEPYQRSAYCGAIGYIDVRQQMDLSIAIRTAVAHKGMLYVWGGGGIVDDSRASEEYAESLAKIRHLMNVLETTLT